MTTTNEIVAATSRFAEKLIASLADASLEEILFLKAQLERQFHALARVDTPTGRAILGLLTQVEIAESEARRALALRA